MWDRINNWLGRHPVYMVLITDLLAFILLMIIYAINKFICGEY